MAQLGLTGRAVAILLLAIATNNPHGIAEGKTATTSCSPGNSGARRDPDGRWFQPLSSLKFNPRH